ncbi:MAG: protein kinase [Planctomycetales bacterium]|nr:protein kinase [Planctomycetales bacterium]
MAELKTFLFTDICRSVDLKNEMAGGSVTERDLAFIESILTPHRLRIKKRLEEFGGRVVSTAGDGHFLVFDNTIHAAQWAIDVQRSHSAEPIVTPNNGRVEVRISVHVGVPQEDPADATNFVGKSVDYASRLNDYATGAQILVSRSVMAILDDIGLDGISFHLHGRRHLKGIGRVEVHELIYDSHGARPLRQNPSSHSDRQWTVIPSQGFEETALFGGQATETSLLAAPALKRVGNYELLEVLGSGGMGDVYKGRHIQFGRERAIKVIKPRYVGRGHEDVVNRFYQEIKAVGKLEHKNIVVAIDSSAPTDSLHYLVMEYIEGVALSELVDQRGLLEVADACEVIRQAARGLQYIHRHGMVHRDIKPSNLMLTLVENDTISLDSFTNADVEGTRGIVKILDLGLALLAEDEHERLTLYDNKAMGTGMYMSPEQWRTTSVDIRADIYSLGCTLYHLLSGKPPFSDSDLRPEKAHEKSRIPPIRTSPPIPRKLWDVLCRMLAKAPEDRYSTPAEVSAALVPFVEGNNLIALVREYDEPEARTRSTTRTRTDTASRVDTWLSRASHLYPTRRWMFRWGLPAVVIAACFGFLIWSAQLKNRRMIEDFKAQASIQLAGDAEKVATLEIGSEINKRFEILELAARDGAVAKLIEGYDRSLSRGELADHELNKWIQANRKGNIDNAPSESWFINDSQGVQIARDPLLDPRTGEVVPSFLSSYAYRNYFHGLRHDLPEDTTEEIQPIRSPNLSAVYTSSNSGKLKVAFSVPIWSEPAAGQEPTVIGVLSMSVDLGEFEVLDSYMRRAGKKIVLVDLREDRLETEGQGSTVGPQRGLILEHPLDSAWEDLTSFPRVAPEVLKSMMASSTGFVAGFHDPLSTKREETYWGAFAQVPGTAERSATGEQQRDAKGWFVLVQTLAPE